MLFIVEKHQKFDSWLKKSLKYRQSKECNSLLNNEITNSKEEKDFINFTGKNVYIWPINVQNLTFAKALLLYSIWFFKKILAI